MFDLLFLIYPYEALSADDNLKLVLNTVVVVAGYYNTKTFLLYSL